MFEHSATHDSVNPNAIIANIYFWDMVRQMLRVPALAHEFTSRWSICSCILALPDRDVNFVVIVEVVVVVVVVVEMVRLVN